MLSGLSVNAVDSILLTQCLGQAQSVAVTSGPCQAVKRQLYAWRHEPPPVAAAVLLALPQALHWHDPRSAVAGFGSSSQAYKPLCLF